MSSWWVPFVFIIGIWKTVPAQDSCLRALTSTISSVNQTLQSYTANRDRMEAMHRAHRLGHFHAPDVMISHFKTHSVHKGNLYLLSRYTAPAFYGSIVCSVYGGYLAEPNDQLEWENLRVMALNHKVQHVYIGITDKAEEGKWVYSYSGTPAWLKFHKSENDGGSGENCASMSVFYDPTWQTWSVSVACSFSVRYPIMKILRNFNFTEQNNVLVM